MPLHKSNTTPGKAENARVEAVKADLQGGLTRAAIMAKYSKKWRNVSPRTYDRYIAAAKVIIDKDAREQEEQLQAAKSEKIEALKSQILTDIELDVILSDIASGKAVTEEIVFDGAAKKFVTVKGKPSTGDRIRAAQELYKRKGSYAPTRKEVKANVRVVDEYVLGEDPDDDSETDSTDR